MNKVLTPFLFSVLFFTSFNWVHAQDTCSALLILDIPAGDGWKGAFVEVILGEDTLEVRPGNENRVLQEIGGTSLDQLEIILDPGPSGEENLTFASVSLVLADQSEIRITGEVFPRRTIINNQPLGCDGSCQGVFPQLVRQTRVGDTFAELAWGDLPNQDSFLVEFDSTGFQLGAGSLVKTTTSSITLNSLSPNTVYDYYIRTICTTGDSSAWVGPFSFSTVFTLDVGVSGVDLPPSDCNLENPSLPFQVQVKNFGFTPQSLLRLGFSVNGEEANIDYPRDGIYTGVVGTGQSDEFQFDAMVNAFDGPGDYEIKVWTFLDGDENIANDTFTYIYTLQTVIDAFPYQESFEGSDRILGVNPMSMDPSWQLGQPAGPAILKVPDGNQAWFSSRPPAQDPVFGVSEITESSFLRFPCLDLTTLGQDPVLSFKLRMRSSSYQVAWVEYSLDEGESWSVLGDLGSGLNWYNGSSLEPGAPRWSAMDNGNGLSFDSAWVTVAHPLTGLSGESSVKLRLAYQVAEGQLPSEILIDDLQVFESAESDLLASGAQFLGSSTICEEDSIEQSIQFDFGNVGLTAQSSISFGYSIDGANAVIQDIPGLTLEPNAEGRQVFSVRVPTTPGNYRIKLWISGSNDANQINDTTKLVVVVPANIVPFREDFEAFEPGEKPFGWNLPPSTAVAFEGNALNKALRFQSEIEPSSTVEFTTPTLGPIGAEDTLTFEYRLGFSIPGDISMVVLGSADCFNNVEVLALLTGDELIQSDGFTEVKAGLALFAGQDIQVRIRLSSEQFPEAVSVLLDNFTITGCQADFNTEVSVTDASAAGAADGRISVTPTTGVPPYTYLWNTGDTTSTIDGLLPGTYTVSIKDTSGCTQQIMAVVDVVTSLVELGSLVETIGLAPNPSAGFTRLSITFSESVDVDWQLYSMTGQKVLQSGATRRVRQIIEDIDVAFLPEGIYLLRIRAGNEWRSLKLVRSGQ